MGRLSRRNICHSCPTSVLCWICWSTTIPTTITTSISTNSTLLSANYTVSIFILLFAVARLNLIETGKTIDPVHVRFIQRLIEWRLTCLKKNESFLIYCSQLLILIFILMLLLLLLLVHSALSLEWICLDLSKKEPTWAEGGRMFHCWRWNFKPISHWKLNNRSVSTWSSDWEWKPLSVGSNLHWKEFVKRWFNRLEDKKGGK